MEISGWFPASRRGSIEVWSSEQVVGMTAKGGGGMETGCRRCKLRGIEERG